MNGGSNRSVGSAVIVGGGVIGLMSAWVLQQRGWRVTILERGPLAMEASWAGGGILAPLPPWEAQLPLWEQVAESLAGYPALCAELHAMSGIDPEWWPCGMAVRSTEPAEALAWCQRQGLACQWQLGSLWLPWVSQLRNPRFCRALVHVLAARGVLLKQNCDAVWLETQAGMVQACHGQGSEPAEVVIVAAGAWSTSVLAPLQWVIPVRPVKGEMLALRPEGVVPGHIVLDGGHYLIPRRDGTVLIGSTLEDCGFDKTPDPANREQLLLIANRLHAGLGDAPCIAHWAGLRPASPDGLPIIARHPDLPNLYANTGHFRYGLTLALSSARRLLSMLR